MSTFFLGDKLVVDLINQSGHVPLGRFKFRHKFLYIIEGSGQVRLDHHHFDFQEGTFYAFRTANAIEMESDLPFQAFLLIFNTTPFPDIRVGGDEDGQYWFSEQVNSLMPITTEIYEHTIESPTDRQSAVTLAELIGREAAAQLEHSGDIVLNSALNLVKIALRARHNGVVQEKSGPETLSGPEVISYVKELAASGQAPKVADLCRALRLSHYNLNKIFLQNTGFSVAQFLRQSKVV